MERAFSHARCQCTGQMGHVRAGANGRLLLIQQRREGKYTFFSEGFRFRDVVKIVNGEKRNWLVSGSCLSVAN